MARSRRRSKPSKALLITLVIIVALVLIAAVIVYAVKPEVYHIYLGFGEHTWSEWQTTKDADCGNDGLKKRECTVCGENESEVIKASGNHNYVDGVCTVCGLPESSSGTLEGVQSSELSIHFLELGNANAGDCTLIKCGNTEVLIDAGSKRNSTETVKEYIDKYCEDGKLEYVIVTHAHEDHIAALAGNSGKNDGVLYSYEIGTIIQFSGHKTTSIIYNDYVSAVSYAETNGADVYTAKQCWYETDGAKKQYFLDGAKTVSMNILYQKYYDKSTSSENNYSVCTLLTQQIDTNMTYNYLFTGDLEKAGEESLVQNNELPEVELFKGGHHGSSTSSNDALLSVIKPKNIAICTCAGTYEYADKPSEGKPEEVVKLNTFPTQEAIDRMSQYTQNIYVTTLGILREDYSTDHFESMNGTIVFYTKNGILYLYCTNNDTILKETEWFKQNRTWNGV